jgi:hypothetical protein
MWVPSEVFRASRSPVSDDLLLGYRCTETEGRGAGVFSRRQIFLWGRNGGLRSAVYEPLL